MFRQFLKTAYRIFVRERFYSLLNVLGLSIGIAVALIILLYLQNDLNYDRYHKQAKNIYRVNSIYTSSGKANKFAMSPQSFGPRIKEEYPEIRAFVRLVGLGKCMVSYGEEKFYEEGIYIADSTVFEIFTHHFLIGNPATCFRLPNSIVLTEKLSRKYFKDKNPIGETLVLNKSQSFQVTGVIQDLPDNVHVQYTALIPVKLYDPNGDSKNASFYDIGVYTYLLLPENYDPRQFYEKFPAFHEKYAAKEGAAYNQQYEAVIQPLLNIHFSNEWQFDLPNGNKTYILAFFVIGLLVLSLSCINYLNMTTARAERRRREIATKKILGSMRSELVFQFLGESMLMAIVAMIVALGMTQFVLGFTSFNQLIDKNLQVELVHNASLVTGILLLTILVGLVSGLYPAFYLSHVHPLKSIQGEKVFGKSNVPFRKFLVIIQMIISIGVIICTLLIDRQINYVRKKDLGINKENLLILPLRDTLVTNHFSTLKEKLLLNPAIESVSTAYSLPAGEMGNNLYRAETENGMEENNFSSLWASYDFIKTLGIKLFTGRDFNRDIQSDFRSAFIINETLAKKMRWDEPLGKRLQQAFDTDGKPYYDGIVIGVVRDFNYTSLHNAIEPLVLRLQGQEAGQLLIRMTGKNTIETMKYIETAWNELADEFPSDFSFLDRNFDLLYKKDQQQNMLVKAFSWICILISCLGLLSLSSYITENRTKEIAIRKVYGASINTISLILYREILILVLIAAIVASPLAYWLTEKFLNDFAYKAGFSFNILLITVAGIILLALGTVSYHSLKASYSDPAKSLKYE
jgi:putative ABC transport system permease protein